MQTNTNITEKTVSKILSDKFKNVLDDATFKDIAKTAWICAGTCVLTWVLTFPDQSVVLLQNVLKYQNYLLPKAVFSFGLFYNLESIIKSFKMDLNFGAAKNSENIEGIPTLELIDYLIENKTFKREEVEAVFGIPRNRFDALAKKLDEIKILTRGANNGRVLNPEMTRQEIFKALNGVNAAKDLKKAYIEIKDGFFAPAPALFKNIKEKLADIFSPGEFAPVPSDHVFLKSKQSDCEIKKNLPQTIDLSYLCKPGDPVFPTHQFVTRKINIERL